MNRLLAMISIMVIALPADAGTITQNTSITGSENVIAGQSFFTGPGGPWTMITFNWFDENGAAVAPGTLYLFTSEYLGTPEGLSSSGYLAASVAITNGKYIFASSLHLASDTEYYAYTDTSANLSYDNTNPYSGGTAYHYVASVEGSPSGYFAQGLRDMAFRVEGVSGISATPEPTSLALFGIGAAGGCFAWRRRRQTAATSDPSFEATA